MIDLAHYVCPDCGAWKNLYTGIHKANQTAPESLPCGWRGCEGVAVATMSLTRAQKMQCEEEAEADPWTGPRSAQ